MVPKTLAATIIKLNGTSYLFWAVFRLFIGAQKKMNHLATDAPDTLKMMTYWQMIVV